NCPLGETLEHEIVQIASRRQVHGRFDAIARETRAASDSDRAHSGNTPNATQANVISTDAANRYGAVKAWCSPSSIPVNPTTRKVAGVSGLTGKPVVICPRSAA